MCKDAEHLIKFYLSTAIKQKDEPVRHAGVQLPTSSGPDCASLFVEQGLESALSKATTLKMGASVPEVAEAKKMIDDFKAKRDKQQAKQSKGKKETKALTCNSPCLLPNSNCVTCVLCVCGVCS